MFDHFTERAIKVLMFAQFETQRFGHREVATIQILLGLIKEETGVAAQILRDAGISLENVYLEVEKIQRQRAWYNGEISFNQHTSQVFELSLAEAEQLKDSEINTQHLLLGLLRQPEGGAIKVLQNLGVDPTQLRTQVFRRLAEQNHPTASQFLPSPPIPNPDVTNPINKAHLALIQKILKHPECSEAQVVRNHPGIIAPELIESVASILEQQGDIKGAEVLRGLITPGHEEKTEATGNFPEGSVTVPEPIEISSLPEVLVTVPEPIQLPDPPQDIEQIIDVPAPTTQEMEKFIFQLVRVTFESKANEQIVYSFLMEKLDKLNDDFPEVLRNWWLSRVTSFDKHPKLKLAKRILKISSLIRKFGGGIRATNLEIALTGYHIIAPIFIKAEYPEQWAITQNCLGLTYLDRVQGNRLENLKQAIAYFTAALSFYNQEQLPKERKIILRNLRKATIEIGNLLGQPEPVEMMPQNPERIRGYYTLIEQLLRAPQNQHQTILDESSELLGAELIQLMKERGEAEKNRGNIQDGELLIAIAEELTKKLPLPLFSVEPSSTETDTCSDNQPDVNSQEGVVSRESLEIENNNNEVLAEPDLLPTPDPQLEFLLQALQLISDGNFQSLYMLLQRNLNLLDHNLPKVLRNWAIPVLADAEPDEAQKIAARINFFGEFLILQFQQGDAASRLEIARTSFKIAGTVFTEVEFPEQSAQIQDRLCLTFLFRVFVAMTESQEDLHPLHSLLAANQDKLNDRFIQVLRDVGIAQLSPAKNLAFASQKIAFQVFAQAIMFLGTIMYEFSEGDKEINLEISIACYEVAATFFSQSAFPPTWALIQSALGKIYCDRIRGNHPENLKLAQQYLQAALEVFASPQFAEQRIQVQQELERVIRIEKQLEETANSEVIESSDGVQTLESDLAHKFQDVQNSGKEEQTDSTSSVDIDEAMQGLTNFLDGLRTELPEREELLIEDRTKAAEEFTEFADRLIAEFKEKTERDLAELSEICEMKLATPNRLQNQGDPLFDAIRSNPDLMAILIPVIVRTLERGSAILEARGNQDAAEMLKEVTAKISSGEIFTNLSSNASAQNTAISSVNLNNSELTELLSSPDFTEMIERIAIEYWAIVSNIDRNNSEPTPMIQQEIIESLWKRLMPVLLKYKDSKFFNDEHIARFFENYSTKPLAVYNHQYNKFWGYIIEAIQKNEGDLEAVAYPILSANLDKLDSYSAQYMYNFVKYCFTSPEPDDASELAELCIKLSSLLLEFPHGNKADKIEIAIAFNLAALEVITTEVSPQSYAYIQFILGPCYHQRIKEDRAENLEKAIHCYTKASEVFTQENDLYFWACNLTYLGNAYCERIWGEPAENKELAIKAHQKALEAPELRIQYPQIWAMVQVNLGTAYRYRIKNVTNWENKEKNLENAITCYENALSIFNREIFLRDWGMAKFNLAVARMEKCLISQADVEDTIGIYQEILQLVFTREAFPYQWGMTQINLGIAYKEAKNWNQAINCFQNALQVFKRNTEPINYLKAVGFLGWTYLDTKDYYNAYTSFSLAVNTLESLHNEIVSGDEIKRNFSEQSSIFYQFVIKACLELADKEQHYYDRAIEYVERSKSRSLVELLTSRNLLPKGNIPEPTLQKLQYLRQEIANEQRRLSNVAKQLGTNDYFAQYNLSFETATPDYTRLNELQRELDRLIDEDIYFIDPNFSLTQKVRSISFSDLKNTLPNHQVAIIEWYIPLPVIAMQALLRGKNISLNDDDRTGGNTIYTFITTLEQEHPIVLQTPIENYIALWKSLEEYWTNYDDGRKKWEDVMLSQLKEFARVLEIDRIVSYIPNVNQIILIPHKNLHLLPLHALPLNDGSYFLDRFSKGVRYAPNCQVLRLTQCSQKTEFDRFLSIQNPTEDLIYADLEVQVIRQYFQPINKALLGKKATKEVFLKQRLNSLYYLHFSCHGYFNPLMPLQSALLLANCYASETPTSIDPMRYLQSPDGSFTDLAKCLTLGEIFNMDLRQCRLVTLSACETGLTEVSFAADEYIGLPSGFLYAGASTVVSSLWAVDQVSTAFLFIKFYENLKNYPELKEGDVSVALQDAQNWLRNLTSEEGEKFLEKIQPQIESLFPGKPRSARAFKIGALKRIKESGTRPFADPFYWAAFIATGF